MSQRQGLSRSSLTSLMGGFLIRTKPTMTPSLPQIKVAILGSGNIGTDLLIKVLRSPYLDCSLFIGRNMSSPGMHKANSLGVRTSDQSIDAIVNEPDCCEMVFDATSAIDHKRHWAVLDGLGKTVVDMTPAKIGAICVPAINLDECLIERNVNMITCGGQASLPMAFAIAQTHPDVQYLEVVSSIASRSAGPATRLNIDEYVDTTATALRYFSGCEKTKAILIINPANPCIDMQTTIFAKVGQANIEALQVEVDAMVRVIQSYVPGYQIILPPTLENDRIAIMVKVQGAGDYLPRYAGNLDIINCAAIAYAEKYAKSRIELKVSGKRSANEKNSD